jgi:hypothetical protein
MRSPTIPAALDLDGVVHVLHAGEIPGDDLVWHAISMGMIASD